MDRDWIIIPLWVTLVVLGVWWIGWAWGVTLPTLIVVGVDLLWSTITGRTRDKP